MGRVSLSTVIVAHNSLVELQTSLPALLSELSDEDELIVVDNASRGGQAAGLEQLAPGVRLIASDTNIGFAAGANRGAAAGRGELIVLLNPDAVVRPGWADAISAPWGGPWAAWMGLLLLEGGQQINTSGGLLHFTGFGWAGQVGEPVGAAPRVPTEVAFLSGACLAIPRATWDTVGGFAEHFFMYCEDVDLSLRLRLTGGALAVIPEARVEHSYTFAKGQHKWRLLERNRWATLLRTYPPALLALVSPALLVTEIVVWMRAIRGGWGRMKALAVVDLIRALPSLVRERSVIQAQRTISEKQFAAAMTADLSSPYFGSVTSLPVVHSLLAAYWRAVTTLLSRR